jgi:hypothetical protein
LAIYNLRFDDDRFAFMTVGGNLLSTFGREQKQIANRQSPIANHHGS